MANRLCVKAAGKGRLTGTAETCLTADANGKVAKAMQATVDGERNKCAGLTPPFAKSDATTVNKAARDEELNLLHDIFGNTLDGPLLTDKSGAKCQAAVSKDYENVVSAMVTTFNKCKKATLKSGAPGASAIEACIVDVGVTGSIAADSQQKVATKAAKLASDVADKCSGVDRIAAFPGVCATAGDLAGCIEARAACRVCRMLGAMDALGADCDAFDDGAANSSCATAPANR